MLILTPIAVPAALMVAVRTPLATGAGIHIRQPVPFSHEHHAGTLNIDCRFCHSGVEQSTFAGMPSTHTCMTCHSQVWTNAPMLAPARESLAFEQPLRWARMTDLPDYVFFDHSIHVNKGVGCESCHGRVDKMPLLYPENHFFMSFCLDCHREPQQHLRPLSEITRMGWQPEIPQLVLGAALLKKYHIETKNLTDCSICHR